MVLPLGAGDHQSLVRVTRTEDGFAQEVLESVSFVPLLGGIS
jgi:protein-L-isoaspartate(D-aspartate) O-methyltransferase